MAILISLSDCKIISPEKIMAILTSGNIPKGGGIWTIENELKPSDLFCYLYAKFGKPNGIQNILRQDDSDNLIHWDWTLLHPCGLITFLGLNLRTEVHLIGNWNFPNCDREQLIGSIKRDYAQFGKEMKRIRTELLEDWDMFVNPYFQLKDSITQLMIEINDLKLNPEKDEISEIPIHMNETDFSKKWADTARRYEKGFGLVMGVRAMTPVLAESFVNLLLYMLCRKDIKENKRLYETTVRANIDIKVQMLHINCIGFKNAVDWASPECKRYNSVVNERNDMLHGNVVIEKQKYGEIHFLGKVPIFKSYQNPWKQTIGVSMGASGMDRVDSDIAAVEAFIEYIQSNLELAVRKEVESLINRRDVGQNKKTGRLGILLPQHIVDFRMPRVSTK